MNLILSSQSQMLSRSYLDHTYLNLANLLLFFLELHDHTYLNLANLLPFFLQSHISVEFIQPIQMECRPHQRGGVDGDLGVGKF
jgi:hypothetical protein